MALVGGAVRDLLLGLPVLDVDIAVEGPVEPLLGRLGGFVRTHGRFGTATAELNGGQVDFARTRRETYAHPGALPDVQAAPLEEDLRRRDFTVNAMALSLLGASAGELISVSGARDDLDARRLRVLHPGSFTDDPTRLLRLARYRSRLGFSVEAETQGLVRAAVAGDVFDTISGARIGHELHLLCAEPEPLGAWYALRELQLDTAIEPGFGLDDSELAARALALLPQDGRREVVLLGLALGGVDPRRRAQLLDRLSVPSRVRDDALAVASGAAGLASALLAATRASEIDAAVGARQSPEVVAVAGALGAEDPARRWLADLRRVRLAITGDDLRAAGVPAGPSIGAGLAAARSALLDGRAPGRDEQLAEALREARAGH